MRSYKKIGLSHEMGLIDTPPLCIFCYIMYSIFVCTMFLVALCDSVIKINNKKKKKKKKQENGV